MTTQMLPQDRGIDNHDSAPTFSASTTLKEYRDYFNSALTRTASLRVVNLRWSTTAEWYDTAMVLTCTYLGKDLHECYTSIVEVMPNTLMLGSITFTDISPRWITVHVVLEGRPGVTSVRKGGTS